MKPRRLAQLVISFAGALGAVGAASAIVVDQSHYVAPEDRWDAFVATGQSIAQTFKVGIPGILARVDLQIYAMPGTVGDSVLEIRTTNNITHLPNPNNDQSLFAMVIPTSSLPIYPGGTLQPVDFISYDVSSANIVVQAGDVLAVSLRREGVYTDPSVIWRTQSSDPYVRGDGFVRYTESMNWQLSGSSDQGFQTWVIRDCNNNTIDDGCEVDCTPPECNVPGCGEAKDCNGNLSLDECDIARDVSTDCQNDDIPDDCQLEANDCNADELPDECQLAGNDCNGNYQPDDCENAALAAVIAAPALQAPCPGGSAIFSVSAPGATAYQWYREGSGQLSNGDNISGAETATLTISPAHTADQGTYFCTVSAGCLSASSASAALDLTSPINQATLITASPVNICVSNPITVSFEVAVDDPTGVNYQWSHNGEDLVNGGTISGANTARLQINAATDADVGFYTCSVTSPCLTEPVSATGELRAFATFAAQPPTTVCAEYGSNAVVTAQIGSPPPTVIRWHEGATPLNNGSKFAGVTTNSLTVKNVLASDNGRQFRLRLTVAAPTCTNYSQPCAIQALPVGGCTACPAPGDMDQDGDYDLHDLMSFTQCFGADVGIETACACANVDDSDGVINLADWTALELLLQGPY